MRYTWAHNLQRYCTFHGDIVEGLRLLLLDLNIAPPNIRLLVDNQAALTIASCGSSWRTRYFGVRGRRIQEEHARGSLILEYCKTKAMVADGLTKMGTSPVIEVLHNAMNGVLPDGVVRHRQPE